MMQHFDNTFWLLLRIIPPKAEYYVMYAYIHPLPCTFTNCRQQYTSSQRSLCMNLITRMIIATQILIGCGVPNVKRQSSDDDLPWHCDASGPTQHEKSQ